MHIALFSDIHANLPAFEAFLADLDARRPDAVYCLGDLIGYHVWPNEVVAEIRRRGIATLAGNHDGKVNGLVTRPEDLQKSGNAYAYHLVDEQHRRYLATLPGYIQLSFRLAARPLHVVLAHGSPRSNEEYVLEDADEQELLRMMAEFRADVLCVGHSHKPYHRVLFSGSVRKDVINIGSVGKPKDGNPDGCYVMLHVGEGEADLQVELIRFSYDVERAASVLENSLLPHDLADRLRRAY